MFNRSPLHILPLFTLLVALFLAGQPLSAQTYGKYGEFTVQGDLQFGGFYVNGNGGTITISTNGARTSTGSLIFLPNYPYRQAQYRYECTHWIGHTVNFKATATPLTRVGGGGQMALTVKSDPSGWTWVGPLTFRYTTIKIGGTLIVGPLSANPPGVYQGFIYITDIGQ